MSNLYIRVKTSFFSHRKTARLRSFIGDAAYWVPLRIWAYCAENQPDGDLSTYGDELEHIVGYSRNASSNACGMLDALKACGFIEENGIVHAWEEHNGYHAAYSERAKKAAEARWAKKKNPQTQKEESEIGNRKEEIGGKHCLTHACSMLGACLEHDLLPKSLITEETIYAEYPKKVGKPVALAAIRKAMEKIQPEKLLELTKAFAIARNGCEPRFCPNPSTWFNQERYNDDPSSWSIEKNSTERTKNANSQQVQHTPEKRVSRNIGTANEGRAAMYGELAKRIEAERRAAWGMAEEVQVPNPPGPAT